MNALPMPSSSVTSDAPDFAWCAAKSPISFALLSAAAASDCASATGSYPDCVASGAAGVLAAADMAFLSVRRGGTLSGAEDAKRIAPSAATSRTTRPARQRRFRWAIASPIAK